MVREGRELHLIYIGFALAFRFGWTEGWPPYEKWSQVFWVGPFYWWWGPDFMFDEEL